MAVELTRLPVRVIVTTDRNLRITGLLTEVRPAGRHFSLTIDDDEAGPVRLSTGRVRTLADAETGETVDDVAHVLADLWCAARIERHGGLPLRDLVDLIPVDGIGGVTAASIAAAFGRWPDLDATLTAAAAGKGDAWARLTDVPGVGAAIARDLVRWRRSARAADWIARRTAGPILDAAPPTGRRLEGVNVVFTGTFATITRDEAKQLAEAAGAVVFGSVSARVHVVVVGADAGSKLERARALSIETIDEAAFLARIGRGPD